MSRRRSPAEFARLYRPQDYQDPWVNPNNARADQDDMYIVPIMSEYWVAGLCKSARSRSVLQVCKIHSGLQ